jgi:exonuclease VII large subunit
MDERKARILAVLCSVAGLALLYISAQYIELAPAPANISTLTLDKSGMPAVACGNVSETSASRGHTFFMISDGTGSIDVVIFNSTAQSGLKVENGDAVCVSGTLEEWPAGSGRPEIVAKKVVA